MRIEQPHRTGIFVRCTRSGIVSAIVNDSIGLNQSLRIGEPFVNCTYADNQERANSFIEDVKSAGTVYDVPIAIDLNGYPKLLSFSGSATGDELLLIGSAVEG